tara:strand:- start:99 stop:749 length:651 start_codon:yes stop_codon:yes gene_type:complete
MAITTYSELKSTVADMLNRSDLTAIVPTFIALAEAGFTRDPDATPIPGIRHWRMQNRATATLSDQYLALPTDWLETVRLHLQGNGTNVLVYADIDTMAQLREDGEDTAGEPQYYNHSEGAIEVYPTPDQDYTAELMYLQRIPALSDSNTSNWLLEYHPDVYLYGALIHSAPYLKDDARIPVWADLYRAAAGALNAQSKRAKTSGSSFRRAVNGLGT